MLGLTPVDDVIETLIGMAKPIAGEDSVPIQDALGRGLSSKRRVGGCQAGTGSGVVK